MKTVTLDRQELQDALREAHQREQRDISRNAHQAVLHEAHQPAMLTPREIAIELGVTPGRVYQLLADPTIGIPHIRFGKAIKIPRAAWLAWLERQTTTALANASKPISA